ncbi:unnamed protein product, partial [Ixodes hexagonus]
LKFTNYLIKFCAVFLAASQQDCLTSWECKAFGRDSVCRDGFCTCRTGYGLGLKRGRLQCLDGATFGGYCSDQRPCSSISRTYCYNRTCLCGEDYVFYRDRCERHSIFSKQEEEPYTTPPRYNLLTILIIVAILVIALLFLVNKRSLFFYFPCCMRDTVPIPGVPLPQTESRGGTEHPANVGILDTKSLCCFFLQQQDKPPTYMEAVLNVQYLPTYQEAAILPPSPPKPS